LTAREKEDWATVCASLSKPVLAPIEKLVSQNPEFKGKGCAAIFATASKRGDAPQYKSNFDPPLSSFRVQGSKGYAIYNGTSGGAFALPMLREGGAWKVNSFETMPIE
jgi:hypothetical protein